MTNQEFHDAWIKSGRRHYHGIAFTDDQPPHITTQQAHGRSWIVLIIWTNPELGGFPEPFEVLARDLPTIEDAEQRADLEALRHGLPLLTRDRCPACFQPIVCRNCGHGVHEGACPPHESAIDWLRSHAESCRLRRAHEARQAQGSDAQ